MTESSSTSLTRLEERFVKVLTAGTNLGCLEAPLTLRIWKDVCEGLTESEIACCLPPILGRLYRSECGLEALKKCGLLPEAGSRALYWQALAVRVGAFAGTTALAPVPAPEAGQGEGTPLDPDAVDLLQQELMMLMDAARAWEEERKALSDANARLEAALQTLREAASRAVESVLENRADAIRGLAALAETSGLGDKASSLRRLPRLPFNSVAAPASPRRPGAVRSEGLSLMPAHQLSDPRHQPLGGLSRH
ncbi:hypothetical protein IHV25_08380 [Phaeovibrio sulfidiphilus]|uniref:Uncharacterized protein n=1 Tax=Phaeovibrio sulfidiphilus TaxID=1220600 RepID=A0A8J6YMV0_9PROT|nr:hypothetical protein [Phaeovibrio sulfidiphilus]MBE1237663.1 hypothetical protein [Phaeovibrio sulfidiphilus]